MRSDQAQAFKLGIQIKKVYFLPRLDFFVLIFLKITLKMFCAFEIDHLYSIFVGRLDP